MSLGPVSDFADLIDHGQVIPAEVISYNEEAVPAIDRENALGLP
jgi:hypothetical protein